MYNILSFLHFLCLKWRTENGKTRDMYFKKKGKMFCFSIVQIILFATRAVRCLQLQQNSLCCSYRNILEMKLRDDKLKKMKCDLQRQQNVFAVMTETNEVAVEASFTV